jgi:phage terminase large subunit-like protein
LLAKLPDWRTKILPLLTPQQAESLLYDWEFCARPDQLAPLGDWQSWLFLAGRGAGKTRAGAEWVRGKVKTGCRRIGLIAPTQADIRDVMIEGTSGVLAVSWEHDRDQRGTPMGVPTYEPSKRHRLTWGNGAIALGYSAEEPDRLRGPQHDALWADEVAAWQDPNGAWDMAMFGLRIGSNPQAMVSTTPRPIPIIRELLRSPTCVATRATTWANRGNLAATFISKIVSKYEGTRLGRQELLGELIEEAEGAYWTRAMIDAALIAKAPDLLRVVVALDPAVTANEMSSLTGIVVAGLGADGRGYVLKDLSGRYSPDAWARTAVDAFDDQRADRIIAEGNQGGDLVRHTITTVRPNLPIRIVHASRSKQARAEPVAALYEQKKVSHVGAFPELEDQLCTWEPLSGMPSPDRLDALVWALTALMLEQQSPPIVMPFSSSQARNIPG